MYSGVEEDGIYDYYNPDAKWDWYEIGGRWSNALKVKKMPDFVWEVIMMTLAFLPGRDVIVG